MNIHTIAIILAGFFWGTNGFFCRILVEGGLTSNQVVFLRFLGATIFFCVAIFCTDKQQFKIKKQDIWCFLGSGFCSLLFFTACYFQAMNVLSLSAAAILLYTAPIFIAIISRVLFKEKFTFVKLLALALSFTGCILVCGVGNLSFSAKGILLGLGAGLGYALYSVFCKLAYERGYTNNTVNFYSCGLASIGCQILWNTSDSFLLISHSPFSITIAILCAFLGCFIPYMLYSYGITVVNISKASILASIELVTATVLGVVLYREVMNFYSILGIIMILSAIFILNIKNLSQKIDL
ncbi:MAG: EamA family transporter [Clostridia bacterium]